MERIVFLFLTETFFTKISQTDLNLTFPLKRHEKFQVGGPGTPAKMFGSPKGFPKF